MLFRVKYRRNANLTYRNFSLGNERIESLIVGGGESMIDVIETAIRC
jgi:hypothetical protein